MQGDIRAPTHLQEGTLSKPADIFDFLIPYSQSFFLPRTVWGRMWVRARVDDCEDRFHVFRWTCYLTLCPTLVQDGGFRGREEASRKHPLFKHVFT